MFSAAMETLFAELKRYVGWGAADEAALRAFHAVAAPEFERVADFFYRRVLEHEEARKALQGGESQVGQLKCTLIEWMDSLLTGPWDEAYYERRARIGHVRIALPQHYILGAMDVIRVEMEQMVKRHYRARPEEDAVGQSGEIRLRGEVKEEHVVLTVEDTGPGVDPSIRARLFEPLITTKAKGIGLGLPLVRRIVERHGGTISYESAPGGGARFVVRLPITGGGAHA